MKIEKAIQQEVFKEESSKAGINILYTASWLSNILTRLLKPFGISWQQFNIMRILQGQQGKPSSLRLVSERMIDQMSNTSRLIDKLVAKDLVVRKECPTDRRQLDLLLTEKGSGLLLQATQWVDENMHQYFGHMSDEQLSELNTLLDALRK